MIREQSELGQLAARYAAAGYAVVPLHFVQQGVCSCSSGGNCRSPAKHPLTPNGVKDASTDLSWIGEQWDHIPRANIGLGLDGHWALDVDDLADLREIEALIGEELRTGPCWSTGRGGQYHLFTLNGEPLKSGTRLHGKAIDVKAGSGAYVVVPPSRNANGPYTNIRSLFEYEPEQAPEALLEWILQPKPGRVLEPNLKTAAGVREGDRHATLLKKVGSEFGLGRKYDEVLQWAHQWGWSCDPPMDPVEVDRIVNDIAVSEFDQLQGYKIASTQPRGLITLNNVPREAVDWHWQGRIAGGKTHLLCGAPGIGKSFFSLYCAAKYSVGGEWPDGHGSAPLGDTLLLSCEDDLNDTIGPRLDVMGADDSRIHAFQGLMRLSDERDLDQIRTWMRGHPIKLVVLDPISEFCGNIDTHKNADVRGVLHPLSELAREFHVAILMVTHFSKGSSKDQSPAVYKAMGSLAFAAHSRLGWAFVRDKDQDGHVLLLPLKCNLGPTVPGMSYRILPDGRLEWSDEPIEISVDEAMEPQKRGPAPVKRQQLTDWLKTQLEDGNVLLDDLKNEAKRLGLSERTADRAKRDVGAQAVSDGENWIIYKPPPS